MIREIPKNLSEAFRLFTEMPEDFFTNGRQDDFPQAREHALFQTIGILGGTFDPIHLGHLHVALSALNGLHLQEVRFIPSAQPLLRSQPIASMTDRLEMVKLAIQDHPGLTVDDCEIKRGGPSYMVDTLTALRQEIGQTPLCCILSTDQFIQFDRWRDCQRILELAHVVVTTRAGVDLTLSEDLKQILQARQIKDANLLHSKSSGFIFFQAIIPLLISGTQIRAMIRAGEKPIVYLTPKVWNYIETHHLYQ